MVSGGSLKVLKQKLKTEIRKIKKTMHAPAKSWLNYYSLNNEGISEQRRARKDYAFQKPRTGGPELAGMETTAERVAFKLVPEKAAEVINSQINRLSTVFDK